MTENFTGAADPYVFNAPVYVFRSRMRPDWRENGSIRLNRRDSVEHRHVVSVLMFKADLHKIWSVCLLNRQR
jgi:hypothetical protein